VDRERRDELVDARCAVSREFARWWKLHEIRPKPSGRKVKAHDHTTPGVTPIAFAAVAYVTAGDRRSSPTWRLRFISPYMEGRHYT